MNIKCLTVICWMASFALAVPMEPKVTGLRCEKCGRTGSAWAPPTVSGQRSVVVCRICRHPYNIPPVKLETDPITGLPITKSKKQTTTSETKG
ncbi:hypothetical protein PGT21_037222 [Puccinia graminis f. sp. tritici]|uniref:GATA-type domain-containing protein n=1 Tax=Puccinia graminis f. sp. tritici TaxID=56615 RepID=A0A5B0N7I8_PUCGR|nr:hypothetical protein PGTUg99_021441 [Puccinia graminis f. sp. tritici]KAA1084732.1 hypothetical protein PGT21_034911 [Puccinia graminis f. sp. tritici]KAA1120165.1 hypothetical protein PGT21_037222 [Puccinia graminis f. sp. tritici]